MMPNTYIKAYEYICITRNQHRSQTVEVRGHSTPTVFTRFGTLCDFYLFLDLKRDDLKGTLFTLDEVFDNDKGSSEVLDQREISYIFQ